MRSRVWEAQRALRERAGQDVWLHLPVDGQVCDFQSLDRSSLTFRHEHIDLKIRAFTLASYGLRRHEILDDLTLDRRGCFIEVKGVSIVDPPRRGGYRIILDIEIMPADEQGL